MSLSMVRAAIETVSSMASDELDELEGKAAERRRLLECIADVRRGVRSIHELYRLADELGGRSL